MEAKEHESENGAAVQSDPGTSAAAIVIERNSKFSGQLKFGGTITIDGQVDGGLIADRIVVNEGGLVVASIDGNTVVIGGTVTGDISAHSDLEILASGVVDGSVTAPAITVRRGARVQGRCTIGVRARIASHPYAHRLTPGLGLNHLLLNWPAALRLIEPLQVHETPTARSAPSTDAQARHTIAIRSAR